MTAKRDINNLVVYETHYELKDDANIQVIGLHELFRQMCLMRFTHKLVTDFSVTRGSLEQVFI